MGNENLDYRHPAQEMGAGQRKALLLSLGILGVFPGILLGSLSSAFIDNVLVGKDYGRAVPIILCYFIFTVTDFVLEYSSTALILVGSRLQEQNSQKYFTIGIHVFTIILNALIIFLLEPFVLVACIAFLLTLFAAFKYYTGKLQENISGEAVTAIQTILKICILFMCGLFVMRSRITMGELYAITMFSGTIFTRSLSLMPQKAPFHVQNSREDRSFSRALHPKKFLTSILDEKKLIFFAIFLALIGMLSESIFLMLQRINLRDCIPSGDWNNLLRNCLFMCGAVTFGFIAKKGNRIGFQQIFYGKVSPFIEQRLKTISRLVLIIIFAVYYGLQIHSYNSLLASQMTIASLIICIVFLSLLTEERRRLWGESFNKLYDMLSKLFFGCMTTYIYCSLALRVTEIAIGDLFVFLSAFQGLFLGVSAVSKTALIVSQRRRLP